MPMFGSLFGGRGGFRDSSNDPGQIQRGGPPGVMWQQPSKGQFIAGIIGDALRGAAGQGPLFGPQLAQQRADNMHYARHQADQQVQFDQAVRLREVQAAQPRYFQNEAGDYVKFDPGTGASSVVYDGPAKPVAPTALQQQVDLYRKLNPAATDAQVAEIVKRGIAGAQYDPGVYQPMVDYRAAAARATKAMPTYAQTHPKAGGPGGKTAATRVVGGKVYYKINGGWYDNPEGR